MVRFAPTVLEALLGLGVIAAIVLGAQPQVERARFAILRAEVPWFLEELKEAQFAHARQHGEYLAAPIEPRPIEDIGPHAIAWSGFEGWWTSPRPIARGAYEVTLTETGFEITGTCDVDGDGIDAVFVITDRAPLSRVTPDHVY